MINEKNKFLTVSWLSGLLSADMFISTGEWGVQMPPLTAENSHLLRSGSQGAALVMVVYAKIQDEQDCHSLQDDLNRLGAWSRKWLLRFNETKCVVLRIRECIRYVYTLNRHQLETESHQKDLGVHVSDSLKPEKHINEICKKKKKKSPAKDRYHQTLFHQLNWKQSQITVSGNSQTNTRVC